MSHDCHFSLVPFVAKWVQNLCSSSYPTRRLPICLGRGTAKRHRPEPDPLTLNQRDTVADVWAMLTWRPHVSGPSPADLSQRRLIRLRDRDDWRTSVHTAQQWILRWPAASNNTKLIFRAGWKFILMRCPFLLFSPIYSVYTKAFSEMGDDVSCSWKYIFKIGEHLEILFLRALLMYF